jgi:hypothetical protein
MRSTLREHGCVKSRTSPTQASGRSRRAITAGSAATSSTPSTSLTTRKRFGLSGIATSRSAAYHRCTSSPATSGAIECKPSTWPISAMRVDSSASAWRCRLQAGRLGRPIRTWAKRSGTRAGMDFLRPAPRGPMGWCSASSLKIRPSSPLTRSHRRKSSASHRRHRPGSVPNLGSTNPCAPKFGFACKAPHSGRVLIDFGTPHHFNDERPHRSLDLIPPAGSTQPRGSPSSDILRRNVLGGLIHEYHAAAA